MKRLICYIGFFSLVVWGGFPIFLGGTLLAQDQPYFVGMNSKAMLEQAKSLEPDNYIIPYFLGQIYLNEGNVEGAVQEWKDYLSMAPQEDSKAGAIWERLTILKLNQAQEYAKKAVKKPWLLERQVKGNTIAILNFINKRGIEDKVFSKGLAAMLISDLSHVPDLKVVEREKMQALMDEIRLGETGLIDKKSALKTGKLLLAKYLVQGDISAPEKKELLISSTVTETLTPEDIGSPQVKGPRLKFFELEKEMVFDILEILGYKKEDLDPALRKVLEKFHTRNLDALLNYARGLDFQDQGMFAEAHEAFAQAVSLDAGFELARDALFSNPRDTFSERWEVETLSPTISNNIMKDYHRQSVNPDNPDPDPEIVIAEPPGETPQPPPRPDVE